MLGKVWRWGVVAPVTALAFAGGIADVVTGTLFYWYLLAPSYFVIAISVWNSFSAKAEARRRAELAAAHREAAGDEPIPEPATIMASDDPAPAEAIVTQVRPVTVWSLADGALRLLVRFLATFTVTMILLILIWAAIEVATRVRGYWYIYSPIIVGIAWFTWTVMRSGPADADEAPATPKLVR